MPTSVAGALGGAFCSVADVECSRMWSSIAEAAHGKPSQPGLSPEAHGINLANTCTFRD